ncbi:MAG: DUF1080 domain-containing protein [Candidatus Brocadiia bacterium]|nr:MAG: DUF1080 domain-containing protein [Candidatus Brocadiia bacterium]
MFIEGTKQMKRFIVIAVVLISMGLFGCHSNITKESNDWQMLFNGKDLSGWKASEKQGCFTVEDGVIKVQGGRSHLYYVGPVGNADFKNFHFQAQVKAAPGSDSGIYFHTEYQETDWPKKGYECQINNSHSNKKRSGGLYDAQNVFEQYAKDNQWYTQEIIVKDKHIVTMIDGKVVVDYHEPDNVSFTGWPGRKLSSGTFAIQGHDPTCVAYLKDIKIRPLE